MKDLSADKSKVDFDSDDDAPIATSFKTQSQLRAKSEKEIRSSIKIAEKKAKEKRKARHAAKKTKPVQGAVKSFDNLVKLPEDEEDEGAGTARDLEKDEDKPRPKKKRSPPSVNEEDEFKISDTFDFRKYLPENIVKEGDGSEDNDEEEEVDSEEEELANAIMEGRFDGGSDDDDDDEEDSSPFKKKRAKTSKLSAKSSSLEASTTVTSKSKRVRRRGGRRFRRKFGAPRVIILDRQETAEEIRQRANEFLHRRLFDSETAPRRVNAEAATCSAAKIRARQASIRSL